MVKPRVGLARVVVGVLLVATALYFFVHYWLIFDDAAVAYLENGGNGDQVHSSWGFTADAVTMTSSPFLALAGFGLITWGAVRWARAVARAHARRA